jgi:hypothetical protein
LELLKLSIEIVSSSWKICGTAPSTTAKLTRCMLAVDTNNEKISASVKALLFITIN